MSARNSKSFDNIIDETRSDDEVLVSFSTPPQPRCGNPDLVMSPLENSPHIEEKTQAVTDYKTFLESILDQHIKEKIEVHLSAALFESEIFRSFMTSFREPRLNDFLNQCLMDHLNCIIAQLEPPISLDDLLTEISNTSDPRSIIQSIEDAILSVCPNLFGSKPDGMGKIDDLVAEPIKRIKELLETFESIRKNVDSEKGDIVADWSFDQLQSSIARNKKRTDVSFVELPSWIKKYAVESVAKKTCEETMLLKDFSINQLENSASRPVPNNTVDLSMTAVAERFFNLKLTDHNKSREKIVEQTTPTPSSANQHKNIIDLSLSAVAERLNVPILEKEEGIVGEEEVRPVSIVENKINDLTGRMNMCEMAMSGVHLRLEELSANMDRKRIFQNQSVQASPVSVHKRPMGTRMTPKTWRSTSTRVTPVKKVDTASSPYIQKRRSNQIQTSILANTGNKIEIGIQTVVNKRDEELEAEAKKALEDEIQNLRLGKKSMLATMQQLHSLNKKLRNELEKVKKSYDSLKEKYEK